MKTPHSLPPLQSRAVWRSSVWKMSHRKPPNTPNVRQGLASSNSRLDWGLMRGSLKPTQARDLSVRERLQNECLLGMARRISTVGFFLIVGGGGGGLGLTASVSGISGTGVGGGASWAGP